VGRSCQQGDRRLRIRQSGLPMPNLIWERIAR
jgi:hypothetical protein